MRPVRVRTWREWFFETFVRGGLFSLRPPPTSQAEREQDAEPSTPPDTITKLNLDVDRSSRD